MPIHCLPVLTHSLHHWPEKGDIKPWQLASQPAYSLLIFVHLYILSSRAVGPQKYENLYTNCLTAGAHQMPRVNLNRREQNMLFNNEGGTVNIKLLLFDQRTGDSEDQCRREIKRLSR